MGLVEDYSGIGVLYSWKSSWLDVIFPSPKIIIVKCRVLQIVGKKKFLAVCWVSLSTVRAVCIDRQFPIM
jgi:hypothetical protein